MRVAQPGLQRAGVQLRIEGNEFLILCSTSDHSLSVNLTDATKRLVKSYAVGGTVLMPI
jgi:hypothetical protein